MKLYKPTRNMPESPSPRRKGTSPPPTNNNNNNSTRRHQHEDTHATRHGELHQRTPVKRGPPHGPPAWTLTRTPKSKNLLQVHPSTTALHPPRPEATPHRTPPGEPIRRTSSPHLSTRRLKQRTTPTSTIISSPDTRGHPRRRNGGRCGSGSGRS
jgi:hypothetical protein